MFFSFLISAKGPTGEQGPKGEQVKRRNMLNYFVWIPDEK